MTASSEASNRTEARGRQTTPRGVSLVRSAEAQRAAYDVQSADSLSGLLNTSNQAAKALINRLRPRAT